MHAGHLLGLETPIEHSYAGGSTGEGHYVQNTGTTDVQFLAVFKTSDYQEVSSSDWLTHTPPELVAQHLNIQLGA